MSGKPKARTRTPTRARPKKQKPAPLPSWEFEVKYEDGTDRACSVDAPTGYLARQLAMRGHPDTGSPAIECHCTRNPLGGTEEEQIGVMLSPERVEQILLDKLREEGRLREGRMVRGKHFKGLLFMEWRERQ